MIYSNIVPLKAQKLHKGRKSHILLRFGEEQEGLAVLRLIRGELQEALGHLADAETHNKYACKGLLQV